ncbi:hypothetical protein SAMN05421734_106109 [Pelagirhabdus alkalitolerans]|uniref:Uncharacterized protein n=1 Tax=Pelagirhabdus alkalitolerans TaxID=1612202 RepID=A0A1G6KJC3_9BACI|nr:hypothetical protein [Pelagirhabdus alkalitolerans]SDC31037.1 hypothetical protein SAMN05421734_106109 [Pelagirhabdus alkalitolerans]
MEFQWHIREEQLQYDLNINGYSSIYTNSTTDEYSLLDNLLQYFQPRSKLKDNLKVYDIDEEYEELSTKHYQIIHLSNEQVIEELKLGSKALLKSKIKNELKQDVEAEGYLNTINSLLDDLVERVPLDLPLRTNPFNFDSLMKLISINMEDETDETSCNIVLRQNNKILPILTDHIKETVSTPTIIYFTYPENYLSPGEQKEMRELLNHLSADVPIIVLTKSKLFLSSQYRGLNYFSRNQQLFNQQLINDMEWEAPTIYEQDELIESLVKIVHKYIDLIEIYPLVSNYQDADIHLFKSIDLYVFSFIMYKLKLRFTFELQEQEIEAPVYKYIMFIYENL